MATASPIVILDQYEVNLHDKLGQGGFGSVYRGKDTRRGTKVAVKQMDLKKEAGADNIGSNALKEIKNLQEFGIFKYRGKRGERIVTSSGKLIIAGDFNFHIEDQNAYNARSFLDLLDCFNHLSIILFYTNFDSQKQSYPWPHYLKT